MLEQSWKGDPNYQYLALCAHQQNSKQLKISRIKMGSLPPLKLISQVWTFCSSGVHWFKSPATSHIESHRGIFLDKQSPTLPELATVLPNLSHHKVSLSQRVGTHRSGTRCPRYASTKGIIVQGTYHPRDALSKGRKTRDFSFGDTSVRDENNIAPYFL